MMSAGVLMGVATVLIEASGSSSRELTATSIAFGSRSGSSPCTFTKTSPSSRAATSATRSVPVRCSLRVIRASPPNPATAFTLRQLGPLVDPLNHRFPREHYQRFPWQARRAISRRNDHHHLGQAQLLSFSTAPE